MSYLMKVINMRMYDLILKKQAGDELSDREIDFFIQGYTEGTIPDYQVSALLMAIYFKGMSDREQAQLTLAMANSGETINLSEINGIKVDKHSTGGVGDTTTLIVAPLVASLGVPVAKMSGRGLGHTGGTIDKLESIPGFHVELETDEFIKLVNKNKIAIMGQSDRLTPADKKLYSLRDVTATTSSIPLIASSIMSKKIASGADAIVLDVKTGSGAFMKDTTNAKQLAHAMVKIGEQVGRKTVAVVSDMNQPLGRAIGNVLEIKEAIDTLKGNGPEDLTELSLTIASQMVVLAHQAETTNEAKNRLIECINNGQALETFKLFLKSQGGDETIVNQPHLLPEAQYKIDLPALESGVISKMIADEIGTAAMMLGAGRTTKDSTIDLSAGIVLHKKLGDHVQKGESLLTIHANHESIQPVKERLYQSIHLTHLTVQKPPLIYDIIKTN